MVKRIFKVNKKFDYVDTLERVLGRNGVEMDD